MRLHLSLTLLLIGLLASSCGTAPESTQIKDADLGPSTTEAPVDVITDIGTESASSTAARELAFADDSNLAEFLPSGVLFADLPADLGERHDIFLDWLEERHDEASSGSSFAELNNSMWSEYLLNFEEPTDAREFCSVIIEAYEVYFADADVAELSVSGWVADEKGLYGDADWEKFSCI